MLTVRALSPLYAPASMRVSINLCSDAGIHPELIHLDEELSKRRDKRLELASRRRTYEVNDAVKRNRAAGNAVWSWWKVSQSLGRLDFGIDTFSVRARRNSS